MSRGYFGIGVHRPKTAENIGTLWRSAFILGASSIFTIGHRYKWQPTDTMKTFRHLQFYEYPDWKNFLLPRDCVLVGVENTADARSIVDFKHPERAIYILGSEDKGLPESILKECNYIIKIQGEYCLNVATAGSIIMYDRQVKESNHD